MDFHNHLLPGIDDGVQSYADAKLTIAKLEALGFTGAVLTPHIYHGVFDNQATELRSVYDNFLAALRKDGIEFSLHLAAEYFADEYFLKLIERGDVLATEVDGERLVLLEFSYLQESPFASAGLAALVAHGYRPVVAHVERYRFVAQAPEIWLGLFERHGAILQGDIGSLAGQHGEGVKKFAWWLLERDHVSIWGTDIHKPGQTERYIGPGLVQLAEAGRLTDPLNPVLGGLG
jgi:tyrosine-protein phosphatase YwqE